MMPVVSTRIDAALTDGGRLVLLCEGASGDDDLVVGIGGGRIEIRDSRGVVSRAEGVDAADAAALAAHRQADVVLLSPRGERLHCGVILASE